MPNEQKELEIVKMYREGHSQTEIVKHLKTSSSTIKKTLDKYDIKRENPKKGRLEIIKERQLMVLQMYKENHSYANISKELKMSTHTIKKVLEHNGVFPRRTKETSRKYNFDINFFESIKTEIQAYWLGFMYADGYVSIKNKGSNSFGVTLKADDKEHLEMFRKHLRADYQLKEYSFLKPNGKDRTVGVRLFLTSDKTVLDLINKGVLERKTLKLKFPNESQVPKGLLLHFLRGYFDGDGCISKFDGNKRYSFQLVGTKEFLESCCKVLDINPSLQIGKNKDKNNYSFCVKGNIQVEKILDRIYKDSHVFLRRKYDLYIDLKLLNSYNHL